MAAVEKEKGNGFKLVKDDKYHPIYVDRHGNEQVAAQEDLFDYLRVQVLGKIGDLFLMAGDSPDESGWGSIFRLLISDAGKKLEQVFDLLEENVGTLTIHSLSDDGYPWYDDYLPLGVFLEPKEAKAEKRRQAEQREAERKDPLKTANSYRSAVAQLLGDLKKDGFNAQSIVKDVLAGDLKPIEQYKVNGSMKGAAKAPAIPLTGKNRKGNGKGAANGNG